ncbi:MAG: hypothetical protein QG626_468 [Patescibacteria group bacterium]|nr:hypothetical protein [Patescibacteria group bacterium]
MCVAVRRCSHREEGSQPKLRLEQVVVVDVVLGAPAGVVGGVDELARRPRRPRGLFGPLHLLGLLVGVGLGQNASSTGEKESCLAVRV